jgi:D-alanyl-lipoteichoic acid acyltransferase DltB (MBOAT superfamily)
MIDPLVHIFWLFAMLAVSFAIPKLYRPYLAAVFGAFFLVTYAPYASFIIALVITQGVVLGALLARRPRADPWRKWGPYLLLLNLFLVDFHPLILGYFVQTIGVSFAVIRLFMATKLIVAKRKPDTGNMLAHLCVAGFYLPALVIGPIFSAADVMRQAHAATEEPPGHSRNYRMIFTGLLLAAFFPPVFQKIADRVPPELAEAGGTFGDVLGVGVTGIALFGLLFTSFWGQSLIAEFSSKELGFSLPQNFNRPWLAHDLQNFWERWHMSMARFVIDYIFVPLQLAGANPKFAVICAFVFMGLWHKLAVGYLIWGFGHGALMAYAPRNPRASLLQSGVFRIVTITCVIALSYIANYAFKGA